MNTSTALAIYDLIAVPPHEVMGELIDSACFTIRDYFLRNPVVAEVYAARSKRLLRYREAAEVLQYNFSEQRQYPLNALTSSLTLEDLLRAFDRAIAAERQYMATTLHPDELIALAGRMVTIQQAYEQNFMALTGVYPTSAFEVKAADQLDTGRTLLLLREDARSKAVLDCIAKERKRIATLNARRHHH
jgi:hypothetical protein